MTVPGLTANPLPVGRDSEESLQNCRCPNQPIFLVQNFAQMPKYSPTLEHMSSVATPQKWKKKTWPQLQDDQELLLSTSVCKNRVSVV
jgi:hypothetical protein